MHSRSRLFKMAASNQMHREGRVPNFELLAYYNSYRVRKCKKNYEGVKKSTHRSISNISEYSTYNIYQMSIIISRLSSVRTCLLYKWIICITKRDLTSIKTCCLVTFVFGLFSSNVVALRNHKTGIMPQLSRVPLFPYHVVETRTSLPATLRTTVLISMMKYVHFLGHMGTSSCIFWWTFFLGCFLLALYNNNILCMC